LLLAALIAVVWYFMHARNEINPHQQQGAKASKCPFQSALLLNGVAVHPGGGITEFNLLRYREAILRIMAFFEISKLDNTFLTSCTSE